MDLYKLQKISTSNSKSFSFKNQVFFKIFPKLSFAHLPYIVTKTSAIHCLEISAMLTAGSVHEISTFLSVFPFFKVSILVLSLVH